MSSLQEMANLVSHMYTIGSFVSFFKRGEGLRMHLVLTEVV